MRAMPIVGITIMSMLLILAVTAVNASEHDKYQRQIRDLQQQVISLRMQNDLLRKEAGDAYCDTVIKLVQQAKKSNTERFVLDTYWGLFKSYAQYNEALGVCIVKAENSVKP